MTTNARTLTVFAVVAVVSTAAAVAAYLRESTDDANAARDANRHAAAATATGTTARPTQPMQTAPASSVQAAPTSATATGMPAVAAAPAATTTSPGTAAGAVLVTTIEAERRLQEVGAVAAQTSMGAVPPAGSGQYGAPDRMSARRINQGDPKTASSADRVKSGDAVRIRYRMFELMSGQEVEASPPEGVLVRVGVNLPDAEGEMAGRLPRQVAEVLGHMRVGDVIEVVLPIGTPDLPPTLDAKAAHKLHVTIVGRY